LVEPGQYKETVTNADRLLADLLIKHYFLTEGSQRNA